MKHPDSRSRPPRLRRVHLPGTVPHLPQMPAPPSDGDENQRDAIDADTNTEADPDPGPTEAIG